MTPGASQGATRAADGPPEPPHAGAPGGKFPERTGSSGRHALVRGEGRYLADLPAADALHAAFVRSPYPSAVLTAVDTSEARALPGVFAVLTHAELAIGPPSVNRFDHAPSLPATSPMAATRIDWPGQPVALVLADTPEAAQAAAERVVIEAEPRDGDEHEVMRWHLTGGGRGAADAPERAVRVSADMQQPRVSAAALEPRGLLARPVQGGAALEVWIGTQSPARARDEIAASLGIAPELVRVRVPDVGGAFGSKASPVPEELLVTAAAWRCGRAVRWVATRSEEFLAGVHGRGGRLTASLTVAPDGRLLALEASLAFGVGGWLAYSALVPARNAARILPGPYRVGRTEVHARVNSQPLAAVNIYRGAGRPEAAVILERLIDDAARALGRDPLALREAALVGADDMPWPLPGGDRLDGGDPRATLALAAQAFDYAQECRLRDARRARGERVGIGIGCYVEPCGQGYERVRIEMDAAGAVTVLAGTASQGQDHQRAFARIAARALGCDASRVTVVEGDTQTCPDGIGALASRSMAIGGSAVKLAAEALAARLRAGEAPPLAHALRYDAPAEAFGHGAVIVRLALDADSLAPRIERLVWADDCGVVIDADGVRAQQLGGLAQGLGQALLEALRYDETGQLLSGSFMDYALPRADAMPASIELLGHASPSPANALGARGIGEAGCIGVPAAILNAARDALAAGRPIPADVDIEMPLTGARLWHAERALARRTAAVNPSEEPR